MVDEIKKCEITSLKVSKMLLEEGVIWQGNTSYGRSLIGGKHVIIDMSQANEDLMVDCVKNRQMVPAFDVRFMNEWLIYCGNVYMKKEGGIYEVRMTVNEETEIYFGSARNLPDAMAMCMLNYIRTKKVENNGKEGNSNQL